MKLILDDNDHYLNFAPLTLTRPVGELRIGILTNSERWKLLLPEADIFYATEEYLSEQFPYSANGVKVNACVMPNKELVEAVRHLKPNEILKKDGKWLAKEGTAEIIVEYGGEMPLLINERWDLYQKNGEMIDFDFQLLTNGKVSKQLSSTNTVIGDSSRIFLEEGAKVEASILNVTDGFIYLGKNAEVMEGSIIRGSLAMCEGSALKLGAKVYGPTTLGPYCKVGGEVNNVVFTGYSNKGHDGFLGNSVIGEWCNLGADTNTSNLKNNYGTVKTYSYRSKKLEQTSIQFMGLVMGDHSKCGINTMFNTATVVGVSSNIFGADFPPKFIPSFNWGSHGEKYNFDKAIESANNMMVRRGKELSEAEISILRHIHDNN